MRMAQPGNIDPAKSLFEDNETIDVLNFMGAIRRRKWLVAGVTLAGTLLAIVIGKSIDPQYTAKSAILIEPVESAVGGAVRMQADEETIANQIRKMQARDFKQRVMEDMDLFNDPEFNPALREETALIDRFPLSLAKQPLLDVADKLPAAIVDALGLYAQEPVADPLAIQLSHAYAIQNFSANLQLANDGVSHVINIGFAASEARKAATISNRVSEIFVSELFEEKARGTDSDTTWLEDRLADLEVELQTAERAVVDYQSRTGGVSAQSTNQLQVDQLNRQLLTEQAKLSAQQENLAQIRRAQSVGGTVLEAAFPSPIIVSLRQQEIALEREEAEARELYGTRHPRMIEIQNEKAGVQAKIQAEVNSEINRLEGDIRVTGALVGRIQGQLANLRSDSTALSQSEVQLIELQRKRDAIRSQYESLLAQYRNLQDQRSTVAPDARIIARAEAPPVPSTPGTKIFAAAGLALSFCLGALGAIVLDRMDRGIRSAREVEKILGLNTLGLVPMLERMKRGQKPYQYLMEKPLSAYAESIRSVFTAIKLSNVDKQPKVVLITSSLPQEGKTTLAVSLATFAARSHKRVLIMDLDLRHPSVHRELGWQVSGGIVEFMANERSLEEVIHHDLETGLHFLPIKGQTTNPTDLLDSQRMRLLLDHCRDNYDYVVLDSAPLASVTDTRVAALLADRVIFCVRWGETVESAAIDSVQSLRDVGVEPAGAIITQVDMKRHALYGYGDVGEYYNRSQKYYVN